MARTVLPKERGIEPGEHALETDRGGASPTPADEVNPAVGAERPPPRNSEMQLSQRHVPVVDDEVTTDAFRQRMKRALALRREGKSWYDEWAAIEQEVYEVSERAAAELSSFGVKAVNLHDGYVAVVELPAEALVRHAHELRRRAPNVRHVRITGYKACAKEFLELDILPLLKSLSLRANGLTDDDLESIVKAGMLRGLHWFDLADNELTERGLFSLARSPSFSLVVFAGLRGNKCPNPVDCIVSDAGETLETYPTDLGRRLEAESPERHLVWLHAPRHFGRLYPPTMADATALADVVLSTVPSATQETSSKE